MADIIGTVENKAEAIRFSPYKTVVSLGSMTET